MFVVPTFVVAPGQGLGSAPGQGLGSGPGGVPTDVEGCEPKRANELRLSMDGVSAFTVPTHASTRPPPPPGMKANNHRNHHHHSNNHHSHRNNNHHNNHSQHEQKDEDDDDEEEEEWWSGGEGVGVPDDVVHWKVLDHTTNSAGRILPPKALHHHPPSHQPLHHRPFHHHYNTNTHTNTPHSLARDALTPLEWESPHLRMAVRDFQIKAQYSFWLDVTAKVLMSPHVSSFIIFHT